jgi:diguanylate cyclase (GGDEF)-like protein
LDDRLPAGSATGTGSNAAASTPPGRWRRLGLRTQLAVVFGALLVAVTVLMSLAFGELLRWRMQREASAALHAVASGASRQLADGLFNRARMVEVLAGSEDLWRQGFDAPGVDSLLSRARALTPFNLWIGVADAEGVVRSATGHLLVGQDVSHRPWFEPGLQRVHVGDVQTSPQLVAALPPEPGGEPPRFLDFAAPIRLDGLTQGVLCMHGSWEWVRETAEALLPADAHERQIALFIFDRHGRLIHAPGGHMAAFAALGQRLPLTRPLSADSGTAPELQAQSARWQDSRAHFLTAVVPLLARSPATDLGWHIVVRQPEENAHGPARQAMYKVLAGGLGAALLAAAVAWLVARRLSQDLKRLSRAASGIHGRGAAADIPLLDSSREVRGLALALRGSIAQLQASNEAMEHQVRERTQQLRQANAELEHQVRSDPLTGLFNRRGFESRLGFAMALARRSGRPLSVLVIDIDHFKRINDRHGHDMGDQVLRTLARVFHQRLRESDVLARMGGEEFLALLPDTAADAAMDIAEQLRALLASTPMTHGEPVTASIGVATLRGTTDSATAMLRRGDQALYAAKAAGRNQVHLQR